MEHYDWNEGWLFAPTFDPALVRPECPELSLTPVRLPHTVKPLPYNYCSENDYQRLCGYRREFFAPKEWLGRTVLLTFGAVAHDATVFCNGRRVFHHGCGYTAFTVDLTGALQLGQKNVVAVRCDSREDLNIPPFGGQLDALTYGGIYRAVSLDIKEPAYLRDVFIEAKAEGNFRIYTATVGETIGCTLQAEIRSPSGSRAAYSGELSLPITGVLNGVHPWSIEHPTLYTLTVQLIRPGSAGLPDRVLDEKTIRFGFRTVQFVAGGLYLNGQRVELRGLNRHQSYAYQGYAMPDSIQRLDAQILKKDLGCNAVRTSHSPQSPAFLDACDELGLLVFPEMPGWQHIGDEVWQAQALQNCREMVCQCRNHPSIFLWGARVNGSADDEAFYKRTNEAIHRLDPTRPTAGSRNTRKSQLLEDVYAYNDYSYAGRGAGCDVQLGADSITVSRTRPLQATDIQTLPHPGFPTDLQAQFMLLAAVAEGTSRITENVFENRFMFAAELMRMGATIYIEDHHALVEGVDHLEGAPVESTDLRGGAALVLAGLAAEGETVIRAIHHIDRGYEDYVGKLEALGANVERRVIG